MPNNKTKTLGQLKRKAKSSGSKSHGKFSHDDVNPSSRRALQFNRIALRADRLASDKKMRTRRNVEKSDRISFFKWALLGAVEQEEVSRAQGVWDIANDRAIKLRPMKSVEDIAIVIRDVYLTRHDDELAALVKERRAGRAKSSRQEQLENQREIEAREFEEGMSVPDLTDEATSRVLVESWTGDLSTLDRLKFITIGRANLP